MEDKISKIRDMIEDDTKKRDVLREKVSSIHSEIQYLTGIIDGLGDALLIIESEGE